GLPPSFPDTYFGPQGWTCSALCTSSTTPPARLLGNHQLPDSLHPLGSQPCSVAISSTPPARLLGFHHYLTRSVVCHHHELGGQPPVRLPIIFLLPNLPEGESSKLSRWSSQPPARHPPLSPARYTPSSPARYPPSSPA
ncbi:hypothetical protein Dimus_032145, partial [Dionaea muscipula]